jgi:predicted negative regulator of RcsB-dependent stress response
MEKARSAQATDILLLLASRIAFEAGDLSSSARLSADALQIASNTARNPGRSATVGEARLMLARVQYEQGQPDKARETLRGAADALSAGLSPEHPLTIQAAALEEKLKT